MSPLMLRVLVGDEDARLLDHITLLESFARLTTGEQRLLDTAWRRLDVITS